MSDPSARSSEARVSRDGDAVLRDGLLYGLRRASRQIIVATQVVLVRLCVRRERTGGGREGAARESRPDSRRDLARDSVVKCRERAGRVEVVAPELKSVRRLDQSDSDFELVADASHTTFDDVVHLQRSPQLNGID